jgi:hypothetical protein
MFSECIDLKSTTRVFQSTWVHEKKYIVKPITTPTGAIAPQLEQHIQQTEATEGTYSQLTTSSNTQIGTPTLYKKMTPLTF